MLCVDSSSCSLYLHDCSYCSCFSHCWWFVVAGSRVVLVGGWSPLSCYLRASFGYCTFFLVVQASMRFPNLPLVVGLWSATSFRSVKGRIVVVDPVSR